MTTATETDLGLVRDQSVTLAALARRFGESEAFAGGLVEAVTGDDGFRDATTEPTEAELADYRRGFALGLAMVDEEAYADGWRECYALAQVEAQRAAEPRPIPDTDIPW
jgi:hypothetical protein